MGKRNQGRNPIIKTNLKTTDRISLIYNDEEVEMSIEDFRATLNSLVSPDSTALGYREYVALLTQTGTSAPTATILKNDLGFTPTLGYNSVGIYSIINTGEYPLAKTTVNISDTWGGLNDVIIRAAKFDANSIYVYVNLRATDFTGRDAALINTAITIRVYD